MSTTQYDFKKIDLDSWLKQGNTKSTAFPTDGTRAFRAVKMNSHYNVFFFSNPWERVKDLEGNEMDWQGWQEVFARDGFKGGVQAPEGQKAVPVNDGAGKDNDPLLSMIEPYISEFSTSGEPAITVNFVFGVNVVDLTKSPNGDKIYENHRIFVFTPPRIRKLMDKIQAMREYDEKFTLLGRCWRLELEGKGFAEEVNLRPVKDVPMIDMPLMMHIPDLVQQRRDIITSHIEAQTGMPLTGDYVEELSEEALGHDIIETDVPEAAEVSSEVELESQASLYESMTDARLKGLLAKSGISVPPKTTRAGLIELATSSL